MRKKPTKDRREVPLQWKIPDSVSTQHATNLVIQASTDEVMLSFFEVLPPILVGSPEDVEKKVGELRSLAANCVARVVVAPAKFKEFLGILNQTALNMEKKSERK